MSWDIFAGRFPNDAKTPDDIPDDFEPPSIGSKDYVVDQIKLVAHDASFEPTGFGCLDAATDVNIGGEDEVQIISFHVYGGGNTSALTIARILRQLDLRAIETGSGDFFEVDARGDSEGLRRWRAYRDQLVDRWKT